jgi:hypothetical protein
MALVYCKTPDVIPQTYYCPTFSKLLTWGHLTSIIVVLEYTSQFYHDEFEKFFAKTKKNWNNFGRFVFILYFFKAIIFLSLSI